MPFVVLILAFVIMFFLLEFCLYYYTFGRSKHRESDDFDVPSGAQYSQFKGAIRQNVARVLSFESEPVETVSHDGLKLAGRYYNNGSPGRLVIFFHGYRSSAVRDGNGIMSLCHDNGYDLLVVDQRAHGKSEGRTITFGIKEREDCRRWVEFAVDKFGEDIKIVIAGLSMGAATVLMASDSLQPQVKGIMADCGFSAPRDILQSTVRKMHLPVRLVYSLLKTSAVIFGRFDPDSFSAKTALKNATVPVLLIHGEADRVVPCKMSRECGEICASECTVLSVPEAGHGMSYYYKRDEYTTLTCSFLEQNFK